MCCCRYIILLLESMKHKEKNHRFFFFHKQTKEFKGVRNPFSSRQLQNIEVELRMVDIIVCIELYIIIYICTPEKKKITAIIMSKNVFHSEVFKKNKIMIYCESPRISIHYMHFLGISIDLLNRETRHQIKVYILIERFASFQNKSFFF